MGVLGGRLGGGCVLGSFRGPRRNGFGTGYLRFGGLAGGIFLPSADRKMTLIMPVNIRVPFGCALPLPVFGLCSWNP